MNPISRRTSAAAENDDNEEVQDPQETTTKTVTPTTAAETSPATIEKSEETATAPPAAETARPLTPPATPPPSSTRRPSDLSCRLSAMRSREEALCYSGRPPSLRRDRIPDGIRGAICAWGFRTADRLGADRGVVAVSLSYLNGFLSAAAGQRGRGDGDGDHDDDDVSLFAATALYLAVKLHGRIVPRISGFVAQSGGNFAVEEIVATEAKILRALEWRMHPPIPLDFVRLFVTLLPPALVVNGARGDIVEMATLLTELSLTDHFFVGRKPSVVAVAALLNAIDAVDSDRFSTQDRTTFLREIVHHNGLQQDAKTVDAVNDVRAALRRICDSLPAQGCPMDESPDEADAAAPQPDTPKKTAMPACLTATAAGETRKRQHASEPVPPSRDGYRAVDSPGRRRVPPPKKHRADKENGATIKICG